MKNKDIVHIGETDKSKNYCVISKKLLQMKFNVENNTEIKYVLELLNTAQKEHDWKYVERAYSKLEKLLESNTHIIARPKAIEPTMFRDPAIGNPFNTTIESIQKGQFENHKLARSSVNIDKQ